jgi:phosphotransacetylase
METAREVVLDPRRVEAKNPRRVAAGIAAAATRKKQREQLIAASEMAKAAIMPASATAKAPHEVESLSPVSGSVSTMVIPLVIFGIILVYYKSTSAARTQFGDAIQTTSVPVLYTSTTSHCTTTSPAPSSLFTM